MFGIKKTGWSGLSDEQLMREVCRGERRAFETLYDRYFNKLVWFARGFTDDVQQAEDLVQDVFIKIIEKPAQFDSTKRFSTWVYVVTANGCRQQLRNQKNRLKIMEENIRPFQDQDTEIKNITDRKLLEERVRSICTRLSEKERSIYILRFEQELSIKEIAEIVSIPEGSVKSGIYYLLKKFAHQLKDFSHEH